ncbi:hypothetical protein DP939_41090 [Spongiactinospora rosea]|uniref:HTH araC/xylS-type domain-containing protein n=1 Tax=Spongiactinospora rosea TaxID=2248750 RepID=A0A366LLQ0_9ACTN|nr:hypothetical protein DP939_41090 [Spongiactinospora rosea]
MSIRVRPASATGRASDMRSTLGPSPGEVLADLGYADQAHFARDFKAMFGESPTHYAERY